MANLYFAHQLTDEAFKVGGRLEVTGEEARHAVRVSRLRVGETTLVGNGRGVIATGAVVATDRDRFVVDVTDVRRDPEPHLRLVLVQALAKGDRDERAVEQATEFGVDAIVPWEAARSVSRWSGKGDAATDKAEKGVAKWERIAREASKQSLRSRIPHIAAPATLTHLSDLAREGQRVLAMHPRRSIALSAWAAGELRHADADAATGATPDAKAASNESAATDIYVVVGPEGGFADHELDELEAAGGTVLALGQTVLRTSSAGPAAMAILNVALGRW